MAWFYESSSHTLNRSEAMTSNSTALKYLNQTQLQEVFQTISIEDFQSMNYEELQQNYARFLFRGGHEKYDSIKKILRATKDQRKGMPYSKVEELKHILADIFRFDVVRHAPVTNHH